MDEEILLTGGRMTPGVVRVGDTVRRPRKPQSEAVMRRLRALRSRGFDYCPEFLGFDSQGREVHRFVPGYTPPDLGYTSHEQFGLILKIARQLHDCSLGLTTGGKVLCHHDLSPCNVIFDRDCRLPGSHPLAIVDWDSCGPGERWEEICYICWLWLDLGNPDGEIGVICEALQTGLLQYGATPSASELTDFSKKLLWRMQRVADSVSEHQPGGWMDTVQWVQDCQDWVKRHQTALDWAVSHPKPGGKTR